MVSSSPRLPFEMQVMCFVIQLRQLMLKSFDDLVHCFLKLFFKCHRKNLGTLDPFLRVLTIS